MSSQLWKAYAKIWQQTEGTRKQTMSDCLAQEIIYRDPQVMADGMVNFSSYIDAFQQNYAGYGFVIKDVETHNDRSLAHWDCVNAEGETVFEGTSFAVINDRGQFTELNGFFPLAP